MKNSKKIFIIVMLMLSVLLIVSCQSQSTEEPMIKIVSGSKELKPIHYGDRYNKDQVDIEKNLKNSMVGKRFSDMPTILYGDEIDIETPNFEADEFEVYDYIMDGDGNIVSNFKVTQFDNCLVKNGKATYKFTKKEGIEEFFDYSKDNQQIHCLLFRCTIGNQSFAFATIVLSDIK